MEIWKDIENYEGLYKVSNTGKVKSLKCNKERILKPQKHSNGYLQIHLWKNNTMNTYKIHRLVAQAFIPNPNNLPEVNHINEIKSENNVENLEWCDTKYNINYGTRTKRTSKPVLQIDKNTGKIIREWSSTMEIERECGFYNSNIGKCCKGKLKSAYGYKWVYK